MPEDPEPIEPGATGTIDWVNYIDDRMGTQIGVVWDNGRSLLLCIPPDEFEIIS